MSVTGNVMGTLKHSIWRFLILTMYVALHIPEEALLGVDGDDCGVLLIGVCGAKVCTLTGIVLKLHTHCHWVSVCLQGWRHDAFNCLICFPKKKKDKERKKEEVNIVTAQLAMFTAVLSLKMFPVTSYVYCSLADLHRSLTEAFRMQVEVLNFVHASESHPA